MGCHNHRGQSPSHWGDSHLHIAGTVPGRGPARPELRVSDAEREAVVAALGSHAGAGRLSVEELSERTDAALAARTGADLDALTADLPRAPRRRDLERERRELRDHVRSYVAVMALLVAIWALTGAGYFWPVWPMLGWGIGVLSHAGAVRPALSRAAAAPRAAAR